MCVCVRAHTCAEERMGERKSKGGGGGVADVCGEQNSLLGANSTPPSQFQCPRPSLTGHSQGDFFFFFFTQQTLAETHTQVLTCADTPQRNSEIEMSQLS